MTSSAPPSKPVKSLLQWTSRNPLRLYFAVLLLAILPVSLFSYYADRLLRRQAEEEAQNESKQQAQLASAFLLDHFHQRAAMLQAYATDPDFLRAWGASDFALAGQFMARAHALQPDAALVSAYDPDGTIRAIAPSDPAVIGENFAYRDWYRGVARDWRPYVSEVYRTRAQPQQLCVAVSVPVRDAGGKVTGIIAAAYSLQNITNWLHRVEQQGRRSILVVDQHGRLVAGADVDVFAPPVDLSGAEPVRRTLRGESGGGVFALNGQRMLVSYLPIPELGWSVLVEQPEAALQESVGRVRRPLALFAIIFGVLALISAVVVSALHHSHEELVQRMRLLAHSEASYRSLIQGAIIGIYRSSERGFISVNSALVEMLGYTSEEELLRTDVAKDIYVEPALRDRLMKEYRGGRRATGVEVQWRRKDGTPISVRISGRYVQEPGQPPVFEGVVENVSERRELEAQLRRSEKLAAVGQVVSGVAHEILNPLTAILGYSEILAGDASVPDTARAFAEKIRQQARRTKTITTNLLSFARQLPGEKTLLDVNRLAESALRLQEFHIGSGKVTFEHDFAPNLPKVHANEYHLLEVCLHVLNNAVDAVERSAEKRIRARTWADDGWVVLEISDSGAGIRDPEHVFDPFYTTKPLGKGVGLGLSACYGIVEDHGGTISCANLNQGGASVTIRLPVAA